MTRKERNYKAINVNFNLDDEKDKALFDFLSTKRAKTAFIKDILEDYMNGNNEKLEVVEAPAVDNSVSAEEVDQIPF